MWASFEVCSAATFLLSKICVGSKHTSYPANLQWILQTYTSSLCFRAASEGALKGILGYTDEDVVSNDFVGDSR